MVSENVIEEFWDMLGYGEALTKDIVARFEHHKISLLLMNERI